MTCRAVVVGAGGVSDSWFPPLIAEQVEIAAVVVDSRTDAARARIAKHGIDAEVSTDLATALDKTRPDFILDLTVPEAHCQVTCLALEAGCHVIGEKPMASSMDEARQMVRTAERTGRLYMVSQNRRWSAYHEAVRRALAAKAIGDVTTVHCDFYVGAHIGGFRDEMASPLILEMSIHHFDLARFMTGVDPVAVHANEFNPRGSWYKGNAATVCTFEMTDEVIFSYRGSCCAEGPRTSWDGNWRIIGTQGTLLYEQEQAPKAQIVAGDSGFYRPLSDVAISVPELQASDMHGALREMLRFLRTGEKPQTECHDNIKSLAMCYAAIDSSKRASRLSIRDASF
ncbi:MAG: Gfo/Idh/MocA family oxidoreductase [Armatimonadetes bacterium]|nr:Gfo/Idh/MocA family oxidoreductase [Armatimonadota bacterium]